VAVEVVAICCAALTLHATEQRWAEYGFRPLAYHESHNRDLSALSGH